MLNIFGAYDSRDLTGVLLADYTENSAMADLKRFTAEYNVLVAALLNDFSEETTKAKSNYGLAVGGEMQPYTETGETEATRSAGEWPVAYPIRRARDAKLYTEERLETITVEDLDKDVVDTVAKDWETLNKGFLRSVMKKANYTFTDGIFPGSNLGDLDVKRLANNDGGAGSVYVDGAKVDLATLQHYFGTNTGAITQAGFQTLYGKLRAVGLIGDVEIRIASDIESTVRGFANFVPINNPLIVNPAKIYSQVTRARAIGRIDHADCQAEIVIQPFMPAGYFFGNDRSAPKPVVRRVHTMAKHRGLKLAQDQTKAAYGDDTLRHKRWERIVGFAVRNRVNGVAGQIVASTTYTDPATL